MFQGTGCNNIAHTSRYSNTAERRVRRLNGSALENVWEILEDGRWESKVTLEKISGIDDGSLNRIISFLNRWNFIEIKRTTELLVRRKPGTASPVQVFQLLSSIGSEQVTTEKRHMLAERVACRSCGGRQLEPIEDNEVECVTCHEKQWYTLEVDKSLSTATMETVEQAGQPKLLRRVLVRLGFPQKAFYANIPKETQYFWFRCTHCGKTSADYPHGYSRYLTCPSCKSRSQFS
jgi:Zn finger protein HypA/HybF involved in hydrogenase expression